MKDFTAIKYLLEVIEEQVSNIEGQRKWVIEYLEEEQTRKNNLYYDDNGEAHSKGKDDLIEDLTRWDVERLDKNIKEYQAKIIAYDTILETLSNIDLNKITKGGVKK